jgi:cell division protein FtsZ
MAEASEPSLFDRAPPATVQTRDEVEAADDLPRPAYQPQPTAAQMQQRDLHHVEEDTAAFIAPRPRAPGAPSPEALARLQAAVSRAPLAGQRPAAPAPAPQPVAQASAERPRFGGINSLINRMTGGHGTVPGQMAERGQSALRQPPRVSGAYDEEPLGEADQDRIEIPAFLRRQAN